MRDPFRHHDERPAPGPLAMQRLVKDCARDPTFVSSNVPRGVTIGVPLLRVARVLPPEDRARHTTTNGGSQQTGARVAARREPRTRHRRASANDGMMRTKPYHDGVMLSAIRERAGDGKRQRRSPAARAVAYRDGSERDPLQDGPGAEERAFASRATTQRDRSRTKRANS